MLRTLVNVDPIAELRAMEDLFDRMFGPATPPAPTAATMPIDVTEQDGQIRIRASVPGIAPDQLEVSVEGNVLSIAGESKTESENEGTRVYRREISYGRVSRSIRLPQGLDLSKVDAEFANGFVTVSIPRLPEEKPQAVRVAVRTPEAKALDPHQEG